MQATPDKDFDQLFKDTFADAEVAPTTDFWPAIENKLAPQKRKLMPIYGFAAAILVLLVSVSLLIFNQQNKKGISTVRNIRQPKAMPNSTNKVAAVLPSTQMATPVAKVMPSKKMVKPAILLHHAKETKTDNKAPITLSKPVENETILAQVDTAKNNNLNKKIELAVLNVAKENVVLASKAENLNPETPINENEANPNKGIRNAGDVLNFIVSKVDKRKDKFIEFSTDEDKSSISSVNIGPFRFGKKNKNK